MSTATNDAITLETHTWYRLPWASAASTLCQVWGPLVGGRVAFWGVARRVRACYRFDSLGVSAITFYYFA